jgi:mRNA-degrading endonuclease RelE of RelBE toxin-antitoxin system
MNLFFSKPFVRDYRKLSKQIQTETDKQIEFLLANPKHPSLNTKKMNDPREIWEGRITKSYRFTYHTEGDTYVLRRVGTHDILKNP